MRLVCAWLAVVVLGPVALLRAQSNAGLIRGRWSITVSVGAASFSGASRETVPSDDRLAFAPYRPTMWGIGLTYGREQVRIGVAARYGQPGLRIRGTPPGVEDQESAALNVLIENAYHLSTFTGSVSTRLRRLQSGPSVRASLGAGIERWAAPGAPIRTIGGGQLGLSVEAALGRGFVAELSGELGFTPASPFRKSDLPEGYEPRSTWRRTLAGGVSWRF